MTPEQVEKFRRTTMGPYRRPYNMPHPHWLYRAFDADGELLYVGCSLNPAQRLDNHATSKVWWELVRNITLDSFPTKHEALAAEAAAIREENPRYNITHTGSRGPNGGGPNGERVPLEWKDAKSLLAEDAAAEKERRAKHDVCPVCPHATWHFNGAPCPHDADVAS